MDAHSFKPIDLQDLPIQALQPLYAVLDPDLNANQRELAELIFIGLSNCHAAPGNEPHNVAQAAIAAVLQVSHVMGGRSYYIGTLQNLRVARLNRAIRDGFRGNNHKQLAREHGITEMRVRQILSTKPKKGNE